jgi:hypothetical protein
VDAFAIVLAGVIAAALLGVWLLARGFPGTGIEQLGLRTAGQITEDREALEAEDLGQMLAAHNQRRRRRGEPEVTLADLERRVMDELELQQRRREAYLVECELDQARPASARLRAKRPPERTREAPPPRPGRPERL